MQDTNQPGKTADNGPSDDMIAFASEVFDVARRGDAAMLDALLTKGVPPNLRNDKGDSLVMLASYHGHADAVRVLLEHKADPNLRNDNGQTPIAGAAFKGFADVVTTLLDHGADVEGASPDGRTALMIAAMFNRVAVPIPTHAMPTVSPPAMPPKKWAHRIPPRASHGTMVVECLLMFASPALSLSIRPTRNDASAKAI
jgi:uncharacterized protein